MPETLSLLAPKNQIYTYNQIYSTYKTVEEIIENLDDYALQELFSGNEKDVDKLFDIIVEETSRAIHTNSGKIKNSSFGYLDKLTENLDIVLKKLVFNYFIITVLYDFEMNWHHIEWGNLIQLYKWICILAARDHSKSFTFSKAYPLWKLYRYEKNLGINNKLNKELNFKRGMIITSEFSLGKDFLSIIKEEIETNDILKEKLSPTMKENWGATEIHCKNGAELQVKSYESRLRGRHPGWIVVDDMLDDSVLYSPEQRQKYTEFFHATIMNLIVPQGQVIIVGCVYPDTLILTDKGLRQVGDFELNKIKEKQFEDFQINLFTKEGFKDTSKAWNNGFGETLKIQLQGGYELGCSLIHPFLQLNKEGEEIWNKSQNLKINEYLALKSAYPFNPEVEIDLTEYKEKFYKIDKRASNLNLSEKVDEELAYLIGLFIAEGCTNKGDRGRISIAANEEQIINKLLNNNLGLKFKERKIKAPLKEGQYNILYVCNNINFVNLLKYLECPLEKSHSKDLPKKIMQSNTKLIRACLQGVYDGDGNIWYSEKLNDLQITLSSVSINLIKNIQQVLFIYFDIQTHIGQQVAKLIGKEGSNGNIYHLKCLGIEAINFLERVGFGLDIKQNKYNLKEAKFKINRGIPNQLKNIQQFGRDIKINIIRKYNLSNIFTETSKLNYDKLELILKEYQNYNYLVSYKKLLDIFNKKYLYLPIKNIIEEKNHAYDFCIPDGHSFISNSIITHNTPFHEHDLYADLKSKKNWKVFEYPAIWPDGSLLWENRYNLDALLEKRESQGSIIFSREILCKPISSESTIFPYHIVEKAYLGMDTSCLVKNYYSSPKKFAKIAIGCDFAISSEIGSDYTVFMVVGVDDLNNYWLLSMWREKGASYNKQIAVLKELNTNFEPSVIYAESNAFQKVMIDIAKDANLNVTPHFTGTNKYDLKNGLPGLAVLFEQNRIRFPRGDAYSRDITDIITGELTSITWSDTKKIESVSEHDDTVYALWLAIKGIHYVNESFSFDFI